MRDSLSIVSPRHKNLVSPEALCESAFMERHWLLSIRHILNQSGPRNHGSIVDAVALIHSTDWAAPLCSHYGHHFLEALVATHTTDKHHFIRAAVGHSSLGNFDQHSEDGLLQRVAQVLLWVLDLHLFCFLLSSLFLIFGHLFTFHQFFDVGKQAWEWDIHTLDHVWKLNVVFTQFRALLNVVAWRWIVRQSTQPCKPI